MDSVGELSYESRRSQRMTELHLYYVMIYPQSRLTRRRDFC